MPVYSNTPPPEASGVAMPIQRTPAARPLTAIITSDDLVGCNTHFWHGHTVPCDPPDCEPCKDCIPYRWHAYCAAYLPNTSLHFLFECTAAAAEQLVQYRRAYGTLRGCQFTAYRWRQSPNGRVIIRTQQSATPTDALPKAPDLKRVLAILWQLPEDNVTVGDPTAFGREVSAATRIPNQHLP